MKTLIAAIIAIAISLMAVVAQIAAQAAPVERGAATAPPAAAAPRADRLELAADAAIGLGAFDLGVAFASSAARQALGAS